MTGIRAVVDYSINRSYIGTVVDRIISAGLGQK